MGRDDLPLPESALGVLGWLDMRDAREARYRYALERIADDSRFDENGWQDIAREALADD